MPRITLTDLVDIVSASGTPKATKVAAVKNRPPYDPRFDFYKAFREHVVSVHTSGGPRDAVRGILTGLVDPKKQAAYPHLVKGYLNWWGRKHLRWFEPPNDIFSAAGIDVRVNPEMGLFINDVPHVIKLYLKADKLTKTHTDIVLHLMKTCLRGSCTKDTVMGILDVRNAKFAFLGAVNPTVLAVVQAELAYVAAIWPEV
ncbi:MAG: hypothetical protein ACYC5Y_13370 [Symbiobacteriia bacterium]